MTPSSSLKTPSAVSVRARASGERLGRARRGWFTTHGARLDDRRQFVHRAAGILIDRRTHAQLIDGGLQR